MNLEWLIKALMASGGPTTITRDDYGGDPKGHYVDGADVINLEPSLEGGLLQDVTKHEIGHALQGRTTGLGLSRKQHPVESAIRQRLPPKEYPNRAAQLADRMAADKDVNESVANFIGGTRGQDKGDDPLMNMILRAMTDSIFRSIYKDK